MANFQGKVSDELYDRLEQLRVEAGGTHAEFMERMASAYEMNQIRYGDNLLSSEVEELESLTSRINRLMVNANEKINSALRDKDLSYEEKQSANAELIARLRVDLETAKTAATELKTSLEEVNKSNTELAEKLQKSEEESVLAKELVSEYKNKNDMLLSDLAEYKQDRETNKQLVQEITTLKEQLLEAQNQANTEAQKVVSLEDKIKKSTEEHQEKLANLEQSHIDKIRDLKDKHRQALDHADALRGIAIKEAKVDAKEEAQAKLEESRMVAESLRKTIDSLKEQADKTVLELKSKHEAEVTSLKEEIEKIKTSTPAKSTSKKKKVAPADNITIEEIESK